MAIQAGDQIKASEVLDLVRGGDKYSFRLTSRYYFSVDHNDHTEYGLTNDEMFAVPFYFPKPWTITKMLIVVSTQAAGMEVRLGIYNDNGSIYPGSLESDCGLIDVSSVGTKELTGLSVSPSVGLIWLALLSKSTTPVLRGVEYDKRIWTPLGSTGSYTTLRSTYEVAQSWGVLPSTFPGGASEVTPIPFIGVYLT